MICLIRKKPVPHTPEEAIRQACLAWMINILKYPYPCISVEKEIPHLNRRLDILVYSQGEPLLVIECKAAKLTDNALRQLLGYHHWLKTPYAALACSDGVKTVYFQEGQIIQKEGLPLYEYLRMPV